MYNIEDFECALRKHIGTKPVLVWSKMDGYHFLSFKEYALAIAYGKNFKIVGVLK